MNQLARIVHDLTNGKPAVDLAQLAPHERAALQDMLPVVRQAPQQLATRLAQLAHGGDWAEKPQPTPIRTDA